MPKAKIGKDILEKKAVGLISTPKEHEQFEEWKEAKKAEESEEIEGRELKSEFVEEKEPTPDQLARERAELQEEMAEAKALGKLKVSKVVLKSEEEE
jgi:hypothetical protein